MVASTLVADWGIPIAFWLASGFIFLAFLVGLRLEFGQMEPEPGGERAGELRYFLRDLNWLFLLAFAFIAGAGMSITNNYFYPYMQELGAEQSTMGIALTLGTIAEVPVMFLANHFINRFKVYGTLIFSLAITGMRLVLFGLVDDSLMVMVIQLTNGLSIPLFIVAGVAIADKYSPEALRTTGQGLFNSAMMGVGVAVGSFTGGILLSNLGGQALFFIYGIAILIIMLIVLFLRSRLLGQPMLSSS
jgi:PPP family 3-phenylpropionic acid transporter